MAAGKSKKTGPSRGRKSGSTPARRTRRDQHQDALVLAPGTEVGNYTLGKVLGRGGFGITYLGKATSGSNRRLAIKEFFIGQICTRMPGSNEVVLFGNVSPNDRRDFELALEKFDIEYQMIKDADHRSIVEYYDFIQANGTAYLIMEYVQGKTFADWLAQNRRQTNRHVSERKLKGLFAKVLDAVDFLHYRNIMHRDITPANIMIHRREGKETPKLIDFGTMGEGLDRVRTQSILAHTPEYSAPEQTDLDGKHGAFTDIFALGGVMYRAICGEPPALPHKRERAVQSGKNDPYKPAASKIDDPSRYSEKFLAGIDKALELDPDDRPQSIHDFQAALGWATTGSPGTIITPHPVPETKPKQKKPAEMPGQQTPRWTKVAAAIFVGFLVMGGMAHVMFPGMFASLTPQGEKPLLGSVSTVQPIDEKKREAERQAKREEDKIAELEARAEILEAEKREAERRLKEKLDEEAKRKLTERQRLAKREADRLEELKREAERLDTERREAERRLKEKLAEEAWLERRRQKEAAERQAKLDAQRRIEREAANQLVFAMYHGVDFFGDDLDVRPGTYQRSWQSCRTACQQRNGCNAFTFNTATRQGVRNCFMKSGTGVREANPNAISGLFFRGKPSEAETFNISLLPATSLEHNVDYFGGDLPGQPQALPRATTTHCRLACIGRSDCVAFTYLPRNGQCWLKGRINQRRTGRQGRGRISGVKQGSQTVAPSNVNILSARN